MSLLEKASSNSENSSAEEKQLRRIVRKPLGRKSEGNLKAANKSKRTEEQFTTPSTFDVPPPPPPKDPIPISIPIKGKGTDNRASMKRGKILNHIPGFSDDEDDAKTFTTQSVTSDSDAASSLQTPTTPAESGSSIRSCDFSQSPYEPPFTIEREDRAIEPYNALTPPPIHRRKKSPVLRLP
ncbi:hypothetical protein CVT26_000467 [Gymnopilus dilepis]|uniref:Uncharacterized protein n=1 Tax=Gymnopilus dilepis TaxID=231916 RepID=A0A409Y2L5_9AGAR|nr:hypothetical protein CVT26_000467 [Gymnopilus dilepis]